MSSSCEFVYAFVLVDGGDHNFLAISPCGRAEPNDLVYLENGALCFVKECIYVNRLSEEFRLLEKMMELSKISSVYAFIWGNQEDNNGTVSGDS